MECWEYSVVNVSGILDDTGISRALGPTPAGSTLCGSSTIVIDCQMIVVVHAFSIKIESRLLHK
jgi:hypothetical protein